MSFCPINFTPGPHQIRVFQSPARFKVLVWHRKCWKTSTSYCELLRWANAIPGTYWYVAPFLSQAKKIIWQDPQMGEHFCPPEIWKNRNNSELYLKFPNGSVVYIMGADNPDSLRGPNPRGVVLDEFDDMKEEVWSAIIQPIMIANPNAWTWFVGTPKGRRGLFKKAQYAIEQMRVETDGGKKSEWFYNLLSAEDSGIISKEALEEAKKTTTEDFYKQEFLCEFLEGAGTFFKGLEYVLWDAKGEDAQIHPKKRYQIGSDWAKVNDYTVFMPFDLTTFKVLPYERFNQIDYNLQKARAEATYLRYNKARFIMDHTGVGTPIFDDLSLKIRTLEPFDFTEQSRKDLLENLKMKIEERSIRIPDDEILLNELKSFQYQLTDRGKVRISCPDSQHDDTVMALALAVWDTPKKPLELIQNEEKAILKEFDFYKLRNKKKRKW